MDCDRTPGSFVDNPDHEALVSGYVEYAPLGGKRMIERGRFNMY
jgi:hypothetical protein